MESTPKTPEQRREEQVLRINKLLENAISEDAKLGLKLELPDDKTGWIEVVFDNGEGGDLLLDLRSLEEVDRQSQEYTVLVERIVSYFKRFSNPEKLAA